MKDLIQSNSVPLLVDGQTGWHDRPYHMPWTSPVKFSGISSDSLRFLLSADIFTRDSLVTHCQIVQIEGLEDERIKLKLQIRELVKASGHRGYALIVYSLFAFAVLAGS